MAEPGAVLDTLVLEGEPHFLRSPDAPRGRECACCDGPHINYSFVRLDAHYKDPYDRQCERANYKSLIDDWTTRKGADRRPIYEGKRVRITVEVIEPDAPAA